MEKVQSSNDSNIKFLNFSKEDFFEIKMLHRTMSLVYALDSLRNRRLRFSNPIKWDDPFEKMFISAKYVSTKQEVAHPWLNRVFCCCFTQRAQSQAFWEIYCKNNDGVQFGISPTQLYDELCNSFKGYKVYIGKVEYLETKQIEGNIHKIPFSSPTPTVDLNNDEFLARLLLLKRNAFMFEEEIRVIVVEDNSQERTTLLKNNECRYLKYSCHHTDIFKSLLLDPRLCDTSFNTLKTIFEQDYGFTNARNNQPRVRRSRLYCSKFRKKIKI